MADTLREVLEDIEKGVPYLTPPGARDAGVLTDNDIANLSHGLGFRKGSKDIPQIKQILIKFYNLYFKGTVKTGVRSQQVVYEAASLAYVEGDFIFKMMSDSPFYPYGPGDDDIAFAAGSSAPVTGSVPSGMVDPAAQEAYKKLLKKFDQAESDKFARTVSRIITEIDEIEAMKTEAKELLGLTGFLALLLCRSVIKSVDQMNNALTKEQLLKNLASVAGWPAVHGYSPPCAKCVEICVTDLARGSVGSRSFFLILTSRFIDLQKAATPQSKITGYLSASVMTHTAKNGVGILSMLDTVCKQLRRPIVDIVKLTSFKQTMESWKQIAKFHKDFMLKTNVQYGYNWARIIDEGYFKNLSPKEHSHLAGIFLGIIEQESDSDVLQSYWAKEFGNTLDATRAIGAAVYRACLPTVDSFEPIGDTQAILDDAVRVGLGQQGQIVPDLSLDNVILN